VDVATFGKEICLKMLGIIYVLSSPLVISVFSREYMLFLSEHLAAHLLTSGLVVLLCVSARKLHFASDPLPVNAERGYLFVATVKMLLP